MQLTNDVMILVAVALKNVRPDITAEGFEGTGQLPSLLQKCWSAERGERPQMKEVSSVVSDISASYKPLRILALGAFTAYHQRHHHFLRISRRVRSLRFGSDANNPAQIWEAEGVCLGGF